MDSKFESGVRTIPYAQQIVYDSLSNLENLGKVADRIPEDKAKDLAFDKDSLSINVAPVGKIKLCIVEREAPTCIKFETEQSPVPFNFWIQLLPVTDVSCKMKLTIKADLNPFIKGMVKKPLQEGIEKVADVLQNIKYK